MASGFSAEAADSTLTELPPIKRPLTFGETDVLRIVEEEFGRQDMDRNLSFTPANEAHLVIESSSGLVITAVCLTSFALFMERGEVEEQELRNDWIRDSRTMINHYWNTNPSLFRLGGRAGSDPDMVLTAGKRTIDFWGEQRCSKGAVEYILFPNTMRKWECPFHVEPITQQLREDLLRIVTKLLEGTAEKANVTLKLQVEWE